ncbi:hypothetical protein TNCV_228301 [Trichonephila clavipes]|nr:hypothetical protein TNCV_228301 [Trichonephila clavipes]
MLNTKTFILLSNTCAWLLKHLASSLPVSTDNVLSQVFIESSASEQVVTNHSGMAAERAGLICSQTKPVEDTPKKVMSSDKPISRNLGESERPFFQGRCVQSAITRVLLDIFG